MKIAKNYLLWMSLLSSIIGLVFIYIAAISIEPQTIAISDITADMEGRKLIVIGQISEKRKHEDGHLFLTLSDNTSKVQVPLFADFMKELGKQGISENDFRIKDKISVEGVIENYKGRLQILPRNLNDVKILSE